MSAPHPMKTCIRHALEKGYMPDKGDDIYDWIDDLVGVVPREHLSWMLARPFGGDSRATRPRAGYRCRSR